MSNNGNVGGDLPLGGWAHATLRITTALTFLSHGSLKLFGFPTLPPPPGQPPMPQPPLLSLFGVAGMLEIVGGLLVLVGLFTRATAFILAGEMAVAYWFVHVPHGGIIPLANGGESAYLFCFIMLWLAAAGAGPFSVDARRSR